MVVEDFRASSCLEFDSVIRIFDGRKKGPCCPLPRGGGGGQTYLGNARLITFFSVRHPLVVCLPSSKCVFLPIESGIYFDDDEGESDDDDKIFSNCRQS